MSQTIRISESCAPSCASTLPTPKRPQSSIAAHPGLSPSSVNGGLRASVHWCPQLAQGMRSIDGLHQPHCIARARPARQPRTRAPSVGPPKRSPTTRSPLRLTFRASPCHRPRYIGARWTAAAMSFGIGRPGRSICLWQERPGAGLAPGRRGSSSSCQWWTLQVCSDALTTARALSRQRQP